MKTIDTSVIISTYNQPEWLGFVLHSYSIQTTSNFEIIVADDGSDERTKALVEHFSAQTELKVIHVWQEDNGFQKSQILNKAIVKCSSPYIIMSDGDCIPRKDFVEQHIKYREEGYFLSGGYFMLPMDISETISKEDVYAERCFDAKWLKQHGLKASFVGK